MTEPSCIKCGVTLHRRPRDSATQWRSRKFCSHKCAANSRASTDAYSRVMEKVHIVTETGCWIYTGTWDIRGYGRVSSSHGRPPYKAHRVSFEHHNGPINDGRFVCHKCDTPSCVNPEHLFLGTQSDNMLDAKRKGRLVRDPGTCSGDRNPFSKLTWAQVGEIRGRIAAKEPFAKIAEDYPVKVSTIMKISQNKQWVINV